MEPCPKCQSIFVPGNSIELELGGSWVDVDLPNLSGREVNLEPHTGSGKISAANKVPPTLATKVIEEDIPSDEEDKKIQCKSAQVDLSNSKLKQVKVDPEEILQKVDSSGITDWDLAEQWETHNLICEYACIFSRNDIDLGKTSIVKHVIRLTASTPFKECYQHFPLGMYEEVKAHTQEMLDTGAIHPSNSSWASAVVLVSKKVANYDSALI